MNSSGRGPSREEPNRFLGFPVRNQRPDHEGEEPQRVMGVPVDWLGSADLGRFGRLAHPVLEYRRWAKHRRGGRHGTDEIEP
ncbi:MAG: hypothetical protein ABSB76_22765 [Streptosporangiaceae bacterium]|jgi:hypothetical protein